MHISWILHSHLSIHSFHVCHVIRPTLKNSFIICIWWACRCPARRAPCKRRETWTHCIFFLHIICDQMVSLSVDGWHKGSLWSYDAIVSRRLNAPPASMSWYANIGSVKMYARIWWSSSATNVTFNTLQFNGLHRVGHKYENTFVLFISF